MAAPLPLDERREACGHRFEDPGLLEIALRHRSWCAEHGGVESNERLEFLGDSVLGLVVTDHLFAHHPRLPEGVLAAWRAELVNTTTLARVGEAAGLGEAVRLGRGEEATGGRTKPSILADVTEAVLGAVFLDAGLDVVRAVVISLWSTEIDDVASGGRLSDHKSRLQETVARLGAESPRYRVNGSGPDHDRRFSAQVSVDGHVHGRGLGRTKKEAEQSAAREALLSLRDDRGGAEPADVRGAEPPDVRACEQSAGDGDAGPSRAESAADQSGEH